VDLVCNQGAMIMKGMRLNATKYLRFINGQQGPIAAGFYTHNKHEVTQVTKSTVLDTAKMFELFVRQLVGIEFGIPPDDEPVNAVREPR
jgi:hypothetical protein